ncbi:hypothetical protein [Paraburkholderia flagellata]|uniref:hypothetical protein n=1 Tax=Paraburkholderia flagellata TaxID=2883241 RepID=UPI001F33B8BE|nr:hypothetical protein [Paraburkholderia flagellata]
MVIVFVIVVFVVMASEIARAVPRMFVTVVIGEIFAIETIYTKTVNSRGRTRIVRDLRRLAAYSR